LITKKKKKIENKEISNTIIKKYLNNYIQCDLIKKIAKPITGYILNIDFIHAVKNPIELLILGLNQSLFLDNHEKGEEIHI